MTLSPYLELYNLVVPKDNMLQQINELAGFSVVYEELKDLNLLDMLWGKTVKIALEKGIIKSKVIIVDATHTKARYNQKSPRKILLDRSRKLRKAVYKADESLKAKFPVKNVMYLRKRSTTVKNSLPCLKLKAVFANCRKLKNL
ncbi:hypothetical protein ABH894_001212 [Paenibacillus sp. RC62]